MTNTPHSIWLGSVVPSSNAEVAWSDTCNADLRSIIVDFGRPLLLLSRNSSSSGRVGARDAAQDLHDVINDLYHLYGLDLRPVVPSIDELVEILMKSENKVTSVQRGGRTFVNRFALIDMSRYGVIASLSAGSARKLDADLSQPHVDWVQRLLREIEPTPAGFLAKRFDRVSRDPWQTGRIIEELRAIEEAHGSVWAGDSKDGRWSLEKSQDLIHTHKGTSANLEATDFRDKTVRGVLNATGDTMVDGRVEFALSGGIPPGLFTFRDRRSTRHVLAIDSPWAYPAADEVEKYLPDVRDADGVLVDQAETISWFLREYARPGVTVRELFLGLLERRFSTQGLRQRRDQGPAAYYGGPTKPLSTYASDAGEVWTRSILSNIDVYETGTLVRRFGPETRAEVVITGVFPRSGAWAEPDVFQRIRAKLADNETVAASARQWSWSGMPVTFNGRPAFLKPQRSQTDPGDVSWVMSRPNDKTRGNDPENAATRRRREFKSRAIPDRVLTEILVEGLVKMNGQPLERFIDETADDPATQTLTRRLETLVGTIRNREEAMNRRYELMVETDPKKALRGTLLERTTTEYYDLESEAKALRQEQSEVKRRLEAVTGTRVGLDEAGLSALFNGLRSPYDNQHRAALRSTVHNLTATTRRFKRAKLEGVEVTIGGDLVIDTTRGPYRVPFEGKFATGAATEADERALRALALLRQGHVARYLENGQVRAASVLVAELLGIKSTQFALSACHDPMLLKLGMAVMFPDPAAGEDPNEVVPLSTLISDPDMREQFGDVAMLAERIRTVYNNHKGLQWLAVTGRNEAQALIRATLGTNGTIDGAEEGKVVRFMRVGLGNPRNALRQTQWTFPTGQWPRLNPCAHCGHVGAALLRIREATGYVCLNPACRRDMAGVRWPARFDQYIGCLEDWLAAGVELSVPSTQTASAREFRGTGTKRVIPGNTKWRQLADLDATERQVVADAYADRSRRVVEIQTTYRVSFDAIYGIVEAEGLTPRRPTRAKWQHRAGREKRVEE